MADVSVRAKSLHQSALVIDGCSLSCLAWHDRLAMSGISGLQITVCAGLDDAREAIRKVGKYYTAVQSEPRLEIVSTTKDIERLKKLGHVGLILGSQTGSLFEDDPALVEIFHHLGFRVAQLTYNERGLLGDGCSEPSNGGISVLGRAVIAEMNRVGMVLDLSHVGERTSLEAIDASSKPVIFSHSNPKARANNIRNITDEQIKRCAARGGVIGVTPYAPSNWTGGAKAPHLEDLLDHAQYIVDLVGIDHVGIGTDTAASGADVDPTKLGAKELAKLREVMGTRPEVTSAFKAVNPIYIPWRSEGIETIEQLPSITQRLLDRSWDETSIRKLLGGNFMRAYRESWGA